MLRNEHAFAKPHFPDATVTIALERELNGVEKIPIAEWFG